MVRSPTTTETALARAPDLASACDAACAALAADGRLSVCAYVARAGRLRALAEAGLGHVRDGVPLAMGAAGRALSERQRATRGDGRRSRDDLRAGRVGRTCLRRSRGRRNGGPRRRGRGPGAADRTRSRSQVRSAWRHPAGDRVEPARPARGGDRRSRGSESYRARHAGCRAGSRGDGERGAAALRWGGAAGGELCGRPAGPQAAGAVR